MKKEVIRQGDIVRVIHPEFFIRCGYPLSIKDGMDMIMNDEEAMTALSQGIDKALNKKCSIPLKDEILGLVPHTNRPRKISNDFNRIIRILAYYRIANEGFGGKERSIYTKWVEEAKGKEFKVIGKKTVATGTYVPASGGYSSYSGEYEYDYEAPFLDGLKNHVILELMDGSYDGNYYFVGNTIKELGTCLWIEKCNVEKVKRERANGKFNNIIKMEIEIPTWCPLPNKE